MRKYEVIIRAKSGTLFRVGVYSDNKQDIEERYKGEVFHITDLGEVKTYQSYILSLDKKELEELEKIMHPEKREI